MNPYVLLAIALAWGGSVGGAFFYGESVGRDGEIAGQALIKQAIADTREAGQQGAAAAIAANRPINRTIVQRAEKEIYENTVYRDCRVLAAGVQLANEALTGRKPEPAGDRVVPGAEPAK